MEADDLIARLEAASGPSRELDALVAQHFHPGLHAERVEMHGYEETRWYLGGRHVRIEPCTGSLDAARQVVPPGHRLTIYCEPDGTGGATVQRDADRLVSTWPRHCGKGATPAIAVVLAGLRARRMVDA